MARNKKTSDYLKELQSRGYGRYRELSKLHNTWKSELSVGALSGFLDTIWRQKDDIKPEYLGENTYNNFRGIAFEEFCFDILNKAIKESGAENEVELYWNQKILVEEFYIFENGQFGKHPKYKAVDIVVGMRKDNLVHPLMIISCKTWQSTSWLDEDRAILDNIRNRYPYVLGYSLCMSLSVLPVSLVSSQRTGLRVFDLSKNGKANEFVDDIKEALAEIRKNAC